MQRRDVRPQPGDRVGDRPLPQLGAGRPGRRRAQRGAEPGELVAGLADDAQQRAVRPRRADVHHDFTRIGEWLKTLRKRNVAVVFATQSLADIAESRIAPAVIESCPTRIFLPNPRALEPAQAEAYQRFGLNDTQVRLIAEAYGKRDYYLQSRAGNRLFELALGPVALAFAVRSGRSSWSALALIPARVRSLPPATTSPTWAPPIRMTTKTDA